MVSRFTVMDEVNLRPEVKLVNRMIDGDDHDVCSF